MELLFIEIRVNNQKYLIVAAYQPQHGKIEDSPWQFDDQFQLRSTNKRAHLLSRPSCIDHVLTNKKHREWDFWFSQMCLTFQMSKITTCDKILSILQKFSTRRIYEQFQWEPLKNRKETNLNPSMAPWLLQ
jgi:hypothetical protein